MASSKGFIWDGATEGDQGDDVRSICITASHVALSIASGVLLEYALRYPDTSQLDEPERQLIGIDQSVQGKIIHIGKELMKNNDCEGTEELPLRQKPGNPCILQQQSPFGTWADVFNYALCMAEAGGGDTSYITNQYVTQNMVENEWNEWSTASEPHDINPNSPDDSFSGNTLEDPEIIGYREIALCYACKLYVDGFCEAVKIYNANATTIPNFVALGLGVAAAVAAIATVASVGATTPLYLALSAAALAASVGVYDDLTDGVLNDAAARRAVACLMFEQLIGEDVTVANFVAAFDASPLDAPNAELIRSSIASMLDHEPTQENQFTSFVNLLGDNFAPAKAGLLPDCLCDETGYDWEEITDAVTGENVELWSFFTPYGSHVAGSYFESGTNDTGVIFYRALVLTRTVPEASILTYAKIEGTYEIDSIADTNDFTFYMTWGAFSTGILEPETPTLPIELTGLNEVGGSVFLQLLPAAITGDIPPEGIARITKITLRGTGTAPS